MGRARLGAERCGQQPNSLVLFSRHVDRHIFNDELTAAYGYDLPAELVAQEPARPRDASRLLVVRGDVFEHRTFRDFPHFLNAGDLLVLNETRVIAARVFGTRDPTGGRVEVLFLRPSDSPQFDEKANRWLALVKPGHRLRAGAHILFGEFGGATIAHVHPDGTRELELDLRVGFSDFLQRAGHVALPPYVRNASAHAIDGYQTIFASIPGSVAAPTASLHFTHEVFEAIQERGVEIVKIALGVGIGTFRPMQRERLEEHVMHSEAFEISQRAADAIACAKRDGRRVVAAGTTVMRALEASAAQNGAVTAGRSHTNLFIKPGFAFSAVDALLTNFHLPKSTLLVLVSAFAGRERMLHAYREAIAERYRFFSFGDAMFIADRAARPQ